MKKKDANQRKQRFGLTLLFSGIIFISFLITMLIVWLAMVVLIRNGILSVGTTAPNLDRIVLQIALFSILVGTVLSAVTSRIPLKPVNKIINAMNRLASGDFKTRLHFGKPFGSAKPTVELCDSFNRMAEELENTEMLRSDFINNFSHEFKTPIVSIAGFASLLKRGKLTEEQRREYIDVIEEESMRLSYMATNVLNLTKVENQTILNHITSYNLSEQIRSSVLLLEKKWEKKHLELNLDFDEHFISANEELLKQVWINLIDNAVKFTPEYGLVQIKIKEADNAVSVAITNTGSDIPRESLERIFQKFYQADESHATEGNGVGLAIVKKVVELHKGKIFVDSEKGLTTFTVMLPCAQ